MVQYPTFLQFPGTKNYPTETQFSTFEHKFWEIKYKVEHKDVVDLEILFCQMCSGLSLIWNRIQLTYEPKNLHGAQ